MQPNADVIRSNILLDIDAEQEKIYKLKNNINFMSDIVTTKSDMVIGLVKNLELLNKYFKDSEDKQVKLLDYIPADLVEKYSKNTVPLFEDNLTLSDWLKWYMELPIALGGYLEFTGSNSKKKYHPKDLPLSSKVTINNTSKKIIIKDTKEDIIITSKQFDIYSRYTTKI